MTDCILLSSYHVLEHDYGSHVTTWSPGCRSPRVGLLYTGKGEGYLQSNLMLNFFFFLPFLITQSLQRYTRQPLY